MTADFLSKRKGFWHYTRRVPQSVSALDERAFARQSTKIRVADDPRAIRAKRVAEKINEETERYWKSLLDGRSHEAQERYDAARARARGFGFDYLEAREVASVPLDELNRRVEAVKAQPPALEELALTAALGGEPVPKLMLSGLLDAFEALTEASRVKFSESQLRKWRNPKKRALSNLIGVTGDKALVDLTRNDALDFQGWWQKRVLVEELEIETANKDIGHLNRMIRKVADGRRLDVQGLFAGLRIEGGTVGQRVAFDPAFVQSRILAEGALDGLNEEARRIVYVMVETGLRPVEICNLSSKTIHLDGPVPHVQARPDGRVMKTTQSNRDMPLVGVALMAMQAQPEGFPRYRDKTDSLSATVNKFLAENGLLTEPGQTLYSLRHTFEDRMTAVEAPDKIAAAMMGHKYHRPRYGRGPSLEQKRDWLHRIAFKPPSRV